MSREKIKQYLIENPVNRNKPNCYVPVAKKFGVTTEYIRGVYKGLRKAGLVEKIPTADFILTSTGYSQPNFVTSEAIAADSVIKWEKDSQVITLNSEKNVKTLEDLIEVCEIDITEWDINSWYCRSSNGRYTVEARLRRKKVEQDLQKQKELIIKEIINNKQSWTTVKKNKNNNKYLLELSLPDVHFGKLAHAEETGEDYDIKIAEQRFKAAIDYLLSLVNMSEIDRIFFPIGNDMVNFDNKHNTTVNGTPQDSDSRFHKVLRTVKKVLINCIDYLETYAPVDVVIVQGNHDETIMFTLGEILDAYYRNNKNININNSPKLRKYYRYGNTSIQLTHGDKEKHSDLGLIFATEEPNLWADTKFRFCQLGHFHKTKKLDYVSVDTLPGFQIQVLPSLSGTDAWHYGKGYGGLKQAKAFLFHKDNGLTAEYTYTV